MSSRARARCGGAHDAHLYISCVYTQLVERGREECGREKSNRSRVDILLQGSRLLNRKRQKGRSREMVIDAVQAVRNANKRREKERERRAKKANKYTSRAYDTPL